MPEANSPCRLMHLPSLPLCSGLILIMPNLGGRPLRSPLVRKLCMSSLIDFTDTTLPHHRRQRILAAGVTTLFQLVRLSDDGLPALSSVTGEHHVEKGR